MVRPLALLLTLLVAAACGGSSRAASTKSLTPQTAVAKGRLHVVMSAQSHHPKIGHTWTYSVRVTNAATGKPVRATIHLYFFVGGLGTVGQVGRHTVSNGAWKETIPAKGPDAFPLTAVGQPLILRATVTAKGYRPATVGWKVEVVK